MCKLSLHSPHEPSKLVALNRGKVAEVFDSLWGFQALVAQLAEAHALEACQCEFDSHREHQCRYRPIGRVKSLKPSKV